MRSRYRYDASYLLDGNVAARLAMVSHGQANEHIAALHSGRTATHLGAGVCYELNTLTCELLRRAELPAGIAVGWPLQGGFLAEPNHLWCVLWLSDGSHTYPMPIDAAQTESGAIRTLPNRPPPKLKPIRSEQKAPRAWDGSRPSKRKKRKRTVIRSAGRAVKRSELVALIQHLEATSGRTLDAEARKRVVAALNDPDAAGRVLRKLEAEE
ncbi:MAG: hypothetical protein AAF938_16545 [Myxococcota bacterium]